MVLDVRTLMIAAVVGSISVTVSLLLLYRNHRTYPGFGYWVAGSASRSLAGVLLLLDRDLAPTWSFVVLANLLLVTELLLYARGTRLFRGRAWHAGWAFATVAVFLVAFLYLTYVTPSVNGRIVVLSLVTGAVALAMVRLLLTRRPAYAGASDVVQAWLWGALALVSLVRAGYTWAFVQPIADLMTAPALQGTLLLALISLALLIALSQIIMHVQRLEHDYRTAQADLERDIAERIQVERALRESESRFRRMADSAPVLIWVADGDGRRSWFNQVWLGFTGRSLAEESGDGWMAGVHPEDLDALRRTIRERPPRGEAFRVEYRLRHRDGDDRWLLEAGTPRYDDGGAFAGTIGSCVDITDRRQLEATLRDHLGQSQRHADHLRSLNRMNDRLVTCSSHDEVFDVIAASAEALFAPHPGGLVIEPAAGGRPALALAWGRPTTIVPVADWRDCVAVQVGTAVSWPDVASGPSCPHCVGHGDRGHLCVPLLGRGRPLGTLQVRVSGLAPRSEFDRVRSLAMAAGESISLTLDSLERREALLEQSIRDPLTGLFNRRYLDETLPREIARAQRTSEPLSVAMLDLDRFKVLNDRFGHLAGDAVLRTMGAFLRRATRGNDLVCRYGGEEITLIFPACDLDLAAARLGDLREGLAALPFRYRGVDLPRVTVSIGVAVLGAGESASAADLLARADAALYRAKDEGRDRIVAFNGRMGRGGRLLR